MTIIINNFFRTFESSKLEQVTEVEITDDEIASGAYGVLYDCILINGARPPTPQVIKVFKENEQVNDKSYSSIIRLQTKLNEYFRSGKNQCYKTYADVPALKAFPEFIFEGTLNGKHVKGFSTVNLFRLGFISWASILDREGDSWLDYRNLPFKTRYQFCYHLVKGFEILSELNYVHADINPSNIFINLISGELSLIDFDGGNVIEFPDDTTQTYGKLEEGYWLSPEVYEAIESNSNINPDQYSDRWSVSIGLHYFIFMFDPFFFIKEHSKKCKEAYLRNNDFYPINVGDENVSANTSYYIEPYQNVIDHHVPDSIHLELIRNYQEGFFNPKKRTQYTVWADLFRHTQEAPTIEYFVSSEEIVFKGRPVTLSWKVDAATSIRIDNKIGDVTGKSEISVRPDESIIYQLCAKGHFGEVQRTLKINIFPIPVLDYLIIPTPDFQSRIQIPNLTIEFPKLNVSIELQQNLFAGSRANFIHLSDEFSKVKPINTDSTVWSISNVLGKIKEIFISK